MSQLSAQSILRYCQPEADRGIDTRFRYRCSDPDPEVEFLGIPLPMISPFVAEKTIFNGMSYGLSATSYDLRIGHDLILGPHPGFILREHLRGAPSGLAQAILPAVWRDLRARDGVDDPFMLAVSLERFAIPHNVSGRLCDKSSRARMGIGCFNTLFDPGFVGFATLELVNLSAEPIVVQAGEPIAQMIFTWLDEPTDRPYTGKYMNAPPVPTGAILEDAAAA